MSKRKRDFWRLPVRIAIILAFLGAVSLACFASVSVSRALLNRAEATPLPDPTDPASPSTATRAAARTEPSGVTPTVTPIPPTPTLEPVRYPYLSAVPEQTLAIFRAGQQYGNRPNVFSKVGDSITATEVFLVPVGLGNYRLYGHISLSSALGYFSTVYARTDNSFANISLAAAGGWRAVHVLTPGLGDPEHCLPDEMPLLCEYRIVRPAFSLIMLGTNDVPDTPTANYESTMRQIIERTINLGIVPVISTIPPFLGPATEARVLEFNAVIVRLAEEYGIPLWDYWSAMQALPNQGMSSDGIHPSWGAPADFTQENLQYGMTLRNLMALQVLDLLYREIILPELYP